MLFFSRDYTTTIVDSFTIDLTAMLIFFIFKFCALRYGVTAQRILLAFSKEVRLNLGEEASTFAKDESIRGLWWYLLSHESRHVRQKI
jgi:hypothetical protein